MTQCRALSHHIHEKLHNTESDRNFTSEYHVTLQNHSKKKKKESRFHKLPLYLLQDTSTFFGTPILYPNTIILSLSTKITQLGTSLSSYRVFVNQDKHQPIFPSFPPSLPHSPEQIVSVMAPGEGRGGWGGYEGRSGRS